MLESKTIKLSLRVTEDEREMLMTASDKHSMTLSEYMRYKILSESSYDNNPEKKDDLMARLSIGTYIIASHLKKNYFDEATVSEIDREISAKLREAGVTKRK